MRRLALSIIVLSTIFTHGTAFAGTETTQQTTKGLIKSTDKGYAELIRQLKDPRTPPIEYWVYGVAQCETRQNWRNGGNWAGGLGIAQRTWYEYGGREFAPRVEQASVTAQLVVANRVAIFGYQWKNRYRTWADKVAGKGMYKYPHYVWGWGCAREHTGDPCGLKKDGSRGKWRPSKYRAAWKYFKANC